MKRGKPEPMSATAVLCQDCGSQLFVRFGKNGGANCFKCKPGDRRGFFPLFEDANYNDEKWREK